MFIVCLYVGYTSYLKYVKILLLKNIFIVMKDDVEWPTDCNCVGTQTYILAATYKVKRYY